MAVVDPNIIDLQAGRKQTERLECQPVVVTNFAQKVCCKATLKMLSNQPKKLQFFLEGVILLQKTLKVNDEFRFRVLLFLVA
jgi:hypothetical protein